MQFADTTLRPSDLVCFPGSRDPLVDRLASRESFLRAVPVSNRFLPEFPAEQNDLPFHLARKIEQSDVEILHLHADGIDLSQCILGALFRFCPLGLAPGECDDIKR